VSPTPDEMNLIASTSRDLHHPLISRRIDSKITESVSTFTEVTNIDKASS